MKQPPTGSIQPYLVFFFLLEKRAVESGPEAPHEALGKLRRLVRERLAARGCKPGERQGAPRLFFGFSRFGFVFFYSFVSFGFLSVSFLVSFFFFHLFVFGSFLFCCFLWFCFFGVGFGSVWGLGLFSFWHSHT